MRILVVGAGVIGSVYAARLSEAGHDVSLLARGARREALEAHGVVLHSRVKHLRAQPRIVGADTAGLFADLTLVAVRLNQLDDILHLVAHVDSPTVAFLQHLGTHTERVRNLVGVARTVFAFPGFGGLLRPDGSVEYVEIGAQPTTIDAAAERAGILRSAIDSTGMRTASEPDMPSWFATHSVFVACLGSGVLSCAGSAERLASDWGQLRTVVQATREGFASLQSSGTHVTPTALRVLFTRMPRWFAAAYWYRALRGPVGAVAVAPHARASRDDEFAALCADALDLAGTRLTPTLNALLTPWAASAPIS